jgi:hypothetical protein
MFVYCALCMTCTVELVALGKKVQDYFHLVTVMASCVLVLGIPAISFKLQLLLENILLNSVPLVFFFSLKMTKYLGRSIRITVIQRLILREKGLSLN